MCTRDSLKAAVKATKVSYRLLSVVDIKLFNYAQNLKSYKSNPKEGYRSFQR